MTYHWLWATTGPVLLPRTRRRAPSVGLEDRSFVRRRRVTVHLVRHPLDWIGESRTYLGYLQRLLTSCKFLGLPARTRLA